jgi:2-phosphosulfolactate phosphatase
MIFFCFFSFLSKIKKKEVINRLKIEVYASHAHVNEKDLRDKTVVVVDTLRATSTVITALNNGCTQVLPVEEVDEAMELRITMKESNAVLGGERDTIKVQGFDFGNSPLEYTPANIMGKTLILTTTNGTLAVKKARQAENIYIGALINGITVASALNRADKDTVLLCAGTRNKFSLEDVLTAGYIIYRLRRFGGNKGIELDDLGLVAEDLYASYRDDLMGALRGTIHYQILKENSMDKDLEYCLKRDIVRVLPVCRDGLITL